VNDKGEFAMSCEILLVEDDENIRQDLVCILEGEGYHVATAVNGSEAITCLQTITLPRLILLDLMMPVMNGWELLQELRKRQRFARIPIIIVSGAGKGAGNVQEQAKALGVAGYLEKPFELAYVLAMVGQHCDPACHAHGASPA
jgi:two-component system, chemotaxis family, chemotaxis protein CheY